MLKIFANFLWIRLPGVLQKQISNFFSKVFSLRFSRFFILPYCLVFGLSSDYLDQFESESGESYKSYSDFFKRRYKSAFAVDDSQIWPCEGYICDWGNFSSKNQSRVKGQNLDLNEIFRSRPTDTEDYYFTNIFLHNHNYHRVHSPIDGEISNIIPISGDLIFLRPWFYRKEDVSYPAFRNERYVFEIKDKNNQAWYLAMVGGFGVGSIELESGIGKGSSVRAGQEIAKFNLGSTVCLATPVQIKIEGFLQTVHPGQKLQTNENKV